jgi:hypothetical protein
VGLMVPIGFCHRFALSACVLIVLALQLNSQTTSSPAQDLDYGTLLTRLKQGDTNIDLPAFRTTTALKLGSAYAALEFRTHSQAMKFFTSGNYQAALELANQTLDRNYASLYGHSDARLACQKLGNAAEAALHEKLLNALADSIMRSGDGKSLETAWFVVDVPEEYFLVGSVLQLQAKSQSLVNKNGHAYDNVVAVDPTTNQSFSLWFNTDVDMGLFKSPSQNASPPNPSRRTGGVGTHTWPCVGTRALPRWRWAAGWRFACTGCGGMVVSIRRRWSSVRTRDSSVPDMV